MGFPPPEPGLVLNYAYLWHDEHAKGLEEGRKDRPSVIVLCVMQAEDQPVVVTVLPITNAPPEDASSALEIPPEIKKHLGLDDARSWIVVAEGNEFVWPGYDLRKVPQKDTFAYGFLPPRYFDKLRDTFVAFSAIGKSRSTPRS